MHIHREGYLIIGTTIVIIAAFVGAIVYFLFPIPTPISILLFSFSSAVIIWTISFFRVPHRIAPDISDAVISSADGTIVAVEEVFEPEYFKDKRIQVSVFMSPFNVHVNWYPMDGEVAYAKYHPGKFLIANHPKSSTENERNTIVVRDKSKREVLVRQIAGMMARRIICFTKAGNPSVLGEEFGLIRFGSRVDFFLPLDAEVKVKIGDKVTGKKTVIARFQK
jgi:phosphatidylserine decarboxylase